MGKSKGASGFSASCAWPNRAAARNPKYKILRRMLITPQRHANKHGSSAEAEEIKHAGERKAKQDNILQKRFPQHKKGVAQWRKGLGYNPERIRPLRRHIARYPGAARDRRHHE